jgi:hypothetical protein
MVQRVEPTLDQPTPTRRTSDSNGWRDDPTENVRALVALEVKRIDDLRGAAQHCADELRSAESRRVDEQASLRAAYDEKLRDAEAKRIDAIRAVDVNAVAVANDRAAVQATVLAGQVAASAEALRVLVSQASAAVAQQFQDVTTQINQRISALERASYEGQGKATYTDPALADLVAAVRAMQQAQSTTTGTTGGQQQAIGWVVAGIALLVGFGGLAVALLK